MSNMNKPSLPDELYSTGNAERPYKCPDCDKLFTHEGYMIMHWRSHANEIPSQFRGQATPKRSLLPLRRNFITRDSIQEDSYSCDVCHKKFSTSWRLEKHQEIHRKISLSPFSPSGHHNRREQPDESIRINNSHAPYSNGHAPEYFSRGGQSDVLPLGEQLDRRVQLEEIEAVGHINGRDKLDELNGVAQTNSGNQSDKLQEVEKPNGYSPPNHHPGRHQSDESQVACPSDRPVQLERCRWLGGNVFGCTQCEKYFTDPTELNNHVCEHSEQKQHTCKVCTRSFSHRDILDKHMRIHLSNGSGKISSETRPPTYSSHQSSNLPIYSSQQSSSPLTYKSSSSQSTSNTFNDLVNSTNSCSSRESLDNAPCSDTEVLPVNGNSLNVRLSGNIKNGVEKQQIFRYIHKIEDHI